MCSSKGCISLALALSISVDPCEAFLGVPVVWSRASLPVLQGGHMPTCDGPSRLTMSSDGPNVVGTSNPERPKDPIDRTKFPPGFIQNLTVSIDDPFIGGQECGEPIAEELSDLNLLKIIAEKATNEEVNRLAWRSLGYRCDPHTSAWTNTDVFPNWKTRFPEPPDLIGVTGIFTREIDSPVMEANRALVRTVPLEHKQSLKKFLGPLGFSGLTLDELTPHRTRRAQITNFLLFYRENLWRVPLEELQKRAREKREAQQRAESSSDPGEYPAYRPLLASEGTGLRQGVSEPGGGQERNVAGGFPASSDEEEPGV
ncbi:unnamed protein product [Discosporangium mesarthrocarpum]